MNSTADEGLREVEATAEINHYLYRHFGADGTLLYVGISLCAIQRLAQHRAGSKWFPEIRKVEITNYLTRADALKAERDAIQREHPKYNIKLMAVRTDRGASTRASITERIEASRAEAAAKLAKFDAVYDERGLAEVLGVGETSVRRLLDSGAIQFFEVPRRKGSGVSRRVTGWALIDWLETQERK